MEKALVSFALIGDPQYADREPCGERNYQYGHALHRETIHKLNRIEDLDFIVSLGDLGDGFSREEIPLMMKISARQLVLSAMSSAITISCSIPKAS